MRMTLNQLIAQLQVEALENGHREVMYIDTIPVSNKAQQKKDKLWTTDDNSIRQNRVTFNFRLAPIKMPF